MQCREYGTCKMVNLCKTHCVRKAMERDGWDLVDGQLVERPKPPEECFTLVFKGNLRKFQGNPLLTETPFGVPFVCAIGDLSAKVDELEAKIEEIEDDAMHAGIERDLLT